MYITLAILFIFVILPFLSDTDTLFGYVRVDEKDTADGETVLVISRIDTGEQITVEANNTKYFLEGDPIDRSEIWSNIEEGNNYWVLLDKNRLPYRLIEKYKLESFYMD